jgi:branched-chain amino acid transport system permease protein
LTLTQFYFLEFSAIYILLGWALYLPFRASQFYFGALYSMCLGGYFAAYVSVNLAWPIYLVIPSAAVICMLFSLIPALKLADLGGFPMLIATMALLIIVQTVTRNLNFLGGRFGIFGVPSLSRPLMLAVTYGLIVLIGFIVYRFDYSYLGRAMDAVQFDRNVAGTLGINVKKLSIQLQLISSMIGGIAGVLYTYTLGSVFPEAFGPSLILLTFAIVIFGGIQTMWGIIIAAPVLWGINRLLPESLKEFSIISYAVLLIAVLIIRPTGIITRKTVRTVTDKSKSLVRMFMPVNRN